MVEKIGTATFIGDHKKMPKGIDRFEEYPLYNSEGFYIIDPTGKQVVINETDWRKTIEAGILRGKDIDYTVINYESVMVCGKNGNHRIELAELTKILKKYDYDINKKRVRTYVTRRPKVK